MLEQLVTKDSEEIVHRLVAVSVDSITEVLLGRGIEPGSISETISELQRLGLPFSPEDVVEKSFTPREDKPTPYSIGRFGDGAFGVFYSAVEEATCKKELAYRLELESSMFEGDARALKRYYNLLACSFNGRTVDLRGWESTQSELISKTEKGYPYCQSLGLEAVTRGIDGMYTPSARNAGGTCVPVFARSALSGPQSVSLHVSVITESGVEFESA